MDIKYEFGINVRREREKRGWTIEKLAEKSNLNANHLGSIERGNENVSLDTIFKISLALDIEVMNLFKFD
ncbi:transcriptional regulator with XRE-family HTH domain [Paenibacillus sp. 4624]|uniref:helix-turn-helix domain-containing protein n=1 Tax=Paenibacillus sp. 4624 TaxID=3156453 RepID=UPI003D1B42DE